jgi:hypothetical protein
VHRTPYLSFSRGNCVRSGAVIRQLNARIIKQIIRDGELNMIGLKLLDQERNDKTIKIYELFVELYPRNFFGFNVLGDVYRERIDAERLKNATVAAWR